MKLQVVDTGSAGAAHGSISVSDGDLTLDVAGDIILDADGGDIRLHDGGVLFGKFTQYQTDFYIDASVFDRDMIFRGIDGGTQFVALTLDMSAAGAATFSASLAVTGALNTNTITINGDSSGNEGGEIVFAGAGSNEAFNVCLLYTSPSPRD